MITSTEQPTESGAIKLAAIVAMTHSRVIGANNTMPWHIPEDLAYFKKTTLGCPVIMGRKTFDSIIAQLGRPLPGRTNLVVTRNAEWVHPGVQVAHELKYALSMAKTDARKGGKAKVFVIGGAEIYRQALPLLDTLYVTEIKDNEITGDAHFPVIDPDAWRLMRSEPGVSGSLHFSFDVYGRKEQQ